MLAVFAGSVLWSQSMDLDTYLAIIKKNNIHLRQAENQVGQSRKDIDMARTALLPTAGAEISYQRDFNRSYMYLSGDDPMGFMPEKLPMNFKNNVSAGALMEQTIFNPVAIANLRLAKLAEAYSKLSRQELSQELVRQASLLFWQALYAKSAHEVMLQNQDLAKEQWESMSNLFKEGYVSEIQLQQAEIYYRQTISQSKNIEASYLSLLDELKVLACIESPDFEVVGVLSIDVDSEGASVFSSSSIENNSSLRMAKSQLALAKQQIGADRAAWFPTMKLGLGYNFNSYNDKLKFNKNNKVAFGQLSVSVPILTGGYNTAKLKKSRLELENAQLAIDQKKREIRKELQVAERNQQVASEKIASEKELIALAERELEISRDKVKLGMATNLELKEIRLSLVQAHLNILNAYLEYRTAQITIKKLLGE